MRPLFMRRRARIIWGRCVILLIFSLAFWALAPGVSHAQFANNAARDAHIAALTAKLNAQTRWIRGMDAEYRDFVCSWRKAMVELVEAFADLRKTPPVVAEFELVNLRCDGSGPVPELPPVP